MADIDQAEVKSENEVYYVSDVFWLHSFKSYTSL